ncbi:TRAP transporter small permease [Roseospira marina]|uniref:TRAP transporter small permease protein n=1 Tax=Roseospira marina TaxID=140057 RepID=A0A5M6IGN0_9PROT|nr:TRAP transporter small permease [Roseospira marina]KAA5607047.1 TRAP transporter small permease [Roseospira marina]MBB4312765.1 TRAP-type C4-dicarboxylate transport system permease small subunit [Roseospira marina]MBB5086462.1 TRAP-type C4-dicarboxylate transport system permease small subunit [Roseospira marina]
MPASDPSAHRPNRDDDAPPSPRRFRMEEVVGATAMAIICVISFANVVVRYATNVSFAFTEEVSVFLLVVLTFVGAALAFATDDHIRITVLVRRLGPIGRGICDALSMLAAVILFGVLAYYGALLTWEEYSWGETSPALGYPTWIYTIWLPLLSLLILARVLAPRLSGLVRRARADR